MAIGTITQVDKAGGVNGPTFYDLLSFTGDGDYRTGGTAAFKAKVKALTGQDRQIIAIIPQDCGVFLPVYDYAADKLKVFGENLVEQADHADLHTTTFHVLVISK